MLPPKQKVAILREHRVEKVAVADLCEKLGIAVNLFYNWQKFFFENGAAAYTANDRRRKPDTDAKDRIIAELQVKLQRA